MNREQYLVYIREYQQRKRTERRNYAVELLGGKCTNCGTSSNLEFDHVIPNCKPRCNKCKAFEKQYNENRPERQRSK